MKTWLRQFTVFWILLLVLHCISKIIFLLYRQVKEYRWTEYRWTVSPLLYFIRGGIYCDFTVTFSSYFGRLFTYLIWILVCAIRVIKMTLNISNL